MEESGKMKDRCVSGGKRGKGGHNRKWFEGGWKAGSVHVRGANGGYGEGGRVRRGKKSHAR